MVGFLHVMGVLMGVSSVGSFKRDGVVIGF